MDTIVSEQSDWERARQEFASASSCREFSKRYRFDPTSRLRLTGIPIDEAVPKARIGGPRRAIFERAFRDGSTVEDVNEQAARIAVAEGGRAERDADVFIALWRGFAELVR